MGASFSLGKVALDRLHVWAYAVCVIRRFVQERPKFGAEGATPETLRQTDCTKADNLESGPVIADPPTEKAQGSGFVHKLSGT